jgi:hypothetical protein
MFLSAISARLSAVIAGHATDDRAVVTCAAAASGWTQLGWFVYDGIPLGGPTVNVVHLVATVDGLVSHELRLTIRRPPPAHQVTADPARLYGTSVAVSPGNIPYIGAVINQREFRFSPDPLLRTLAGWQRSFERPAPYLYWWNSEARTTTVDGADLRVGDWTFIGLMPDTHLENEAAAAVIAMLNVTFASPIPIDPNHTEETRALLSLRDYLVSATERDPVIGLLLRAVVLGWLEVIGQRFAAGTLAYSPTLPLLVVSDDEVEVAFAAATADASRRALDDPMHAVFQEWLGPRLSDASSRPRVNAGTLFHVRAKRDGTVVRERVADGIWCTSVALRRHPVNGRSAILALGLQATMDGRPRTTPILFERRGADDWDARTIVTGSPIFNADFTFLPDGTPRIVASQWDDATGLPRLIAFAPSNGGWSRSPINWRTAAPTTDAEPMDPEARDIGAFPRIIADAEGRIAVAFVTPVIRGRSGTIDPAARSAGCLRSPIAAAGAHAASTVQRRVVSRATHHRIPTKRSRWGWSARVRAARSPSLPPSPWKRTARSATRSATACSAWRRSTVPRS